MIIPDILSSLCLEEVPRGLALFREDRRRFLSMISLYAYYDQIYPSFSLRLFALARTPAFTLNHFDDDIIVCLYLIDPWSFDLSFAV